VTFDNLLPTFPAVVHRAPFGRVFENSQLMYAIGKLVRLL
jgi:hypothetical protein